MAIALDLVGVVVVAGALFGIVWFWRRVTPPAECPFCHSRSWFILGGDHTKQCRDCGRLFV